MATCYLEGSSFKGKGDQTGLCLSGALIYLPFLHSLILINPTKKRAVEAMMQQMHSKSERDDFFTNILQARRPETGEPYDKRELMGEAILLLFVQTAHIPDSVISLLIKVV